MDRCKQCGYVYDDVSRDEIATRLRGAPDRFSGVVANASPQAAALRPDPQTWSAIEYVGHLRDVLLVQRERAVLALVEDCPSFARMWREERVELCHYRDQDREQMLGQLKMAAELCALVFGGLDGAAWNRPLIYNWPEPAKFDVAWLGRHTVHEIEHHLQDVTSVLHRADAAS